MEDITKNDLTDLCRVCMSRNLNMKPLFDVTNKNIIGKIQFCTGIMLRPISGHPAQICRVCMRNLSIAYKFKRTCLQADKALDQRISRIKTEPTEGDNMLNCPEDDDNEFHQSDGDVNNPDNVKHDSVETDKGREIKSEDGGDKSSSETCNDNSSETIECLAADKSEEHKTPVRLKKFKFRKLFCETCDIKFENKAASDAHRRKVHKEEIGWVCEICGKNFVHRASLHTHLRSHMPPQHACDRCDYRTSNKYDLVKHLRTHTGEKKYKCVLCPASYHTASNLRQHARRQHELERRWPCPRLACGKCFSDRSKLNRHIDAHDEVKRHVCTVCHAAFSRRCHWKKHLHKQHNIEVPRIRPGRQKENFLVEHFTQFTTKTANNRRLWRGHRRRLMHPVNLPMTKRQN